ncbi:tail-collar fiber protein [Sinobacterium caligoides]|uniref:Tail-collar fiber protein n=1 Tax=Sinobacterium caligoides TaxID=933926 RepID=A0A3N2E0P6_9GAMM|nr:phage tail protein [Sinobacterium caligoides]ROS05674.1 tail-collar fiber protein [Sinobacterium caligoides]
MSVIIQPLITKAGITAMINAQENGFKVKITHVGVGDGVPGGYKALDTQASLKSELHRVEVSGGELIGSKHNQLHITAIVNERSGNPPNHNYDIYEVGFYLSDGTLFAIYASEQDKIAQKVLGTDFLLAFDITLSGVSADAVVIDGDSNLALPLPVARDNLLLGENTVKIHTQYQFDQLFNQGDKTVVEENTTIVLSPIQGTKEGEISCGAWGGVGDEAHNSYNGRPAYILKNSIVLRSGVCIIGFNPYDTVVIKSSADIKVFVGSMDHPVDGVLLEGWSFDGRGGVNSLGGTLVGSGSGGAFYLDHADHCQLNCHVINHKIHNDNNTALGGGIYAVRGENRYLQAQYIISNSADNGGGVANALLANLTITDCQATKAGAVGSGAVGGELSNYHFVGCVGDSAVKGVSNQDGSRIGVGTISPQGALHISSAKNGSCDVILEADTDNNNEADTPSILFRQDGGFDRSNIKQADNELIISNAAERYQDRVGGIIFKTANDQNIDNAVERMNISAEGKVSVKESLSVGNSVGIGTDNPKANLHISSGDAGDCKLILESDTDDNNEGDNASIIFRQDGGYDSSSIRQADNALELVNHATIRGGITLKTTAELGKDKERFHITAGGNVGVGTVTPSHLLDVNGDVVAKRLGLNTGTNTSLHLNVAGYGSMKRLHVGDDQSEDKGLNQGHIKDGDVLADRFVDKKNGNYYVQPSSRSNFVDVVSNGHVAQNSNITNSLTMNNRTPIEIVRFKSGENRDTSDWPPGEWNAVITGFDTGVADIQEDGSGRFMGVQMLISNGQWYIYSLLHTHHDGADWEVDVMFIRKEMSSRRNF